MTDSTQTYLAVKLGNHTFGINASYVVEVLDMLDIARVPGMPDFIPGIINFRGTILSIIDLHILLKMQVIDDDRPKSLIILEITFNQKPMVVGIVVDGVNEVFSYKKNDIKPLPPLGNKFPIRYTEGIAKTGGHYIVILNPDSIFTPEVLCPGYTF